MMRDVGTLRELDVKVGDVVECLINSCGAEYDRENPFTIREDGSAGNVTEHYDSDSPSVFRIISRASDTPKIWREMTDAEKGALLLAFHNGGEIEFLHGKKYQKWYKCGDGVAWHDDIAYRVVPKKPVVETVTLYWKEGQGAFASMAAGSSTHRITFTTTDGIPDCDSVKMEAIK